MALKIFHVFLFAFAFCPFDYVKSQDKAILSGYVKEGGSSETLIGVNVKLFPQRNGVLDSSSVTGVISNMYGYYSITVERGTYMVEFSFIGFESKSVLLELRENKVLNIEISTIPEALSEVVVSASQSRTKNTEISINQIDPKTIEKLPAILGEPDVLRSIQLLPGVSSANEASSGFNVRGGSADQNLVLLDDAIIYNASHLFGLFSVFNTDAISNIKLYKGGIPSQYGGRLSSVLSINQKEGNRNKLGGSASIGLISSKILIEGPLSKKEPDGARSSFMIAGRRSYADLFTFLNSEFEGNQLFFYDLNMKANYELNEKNKLFVSGYFGRDRFRLPGLVSTYWGNASGSIRYTSIINQKLFFQSNLTLSNYDYNLDILRAGSELRWKSSILNFNLKPQLTWYVNPGLQMRVGLDALTYDFKPGDISPIEGSPVIPITFDQKRALEGAMFVDVEQELSPRLELRYGLRLSGFWQLGSAAVNKYNNGKPLSYDNALQTYVDNEVTGITFYDRNETVEFYQGLEPRISMNYSFDDDQSIKLGYNRMFQYVHLISNTTSPTPLDIWTPSATYLEPQRADQLSLGYFRDLGRQGISFSSEVFYKDIARKTEFVDGADLLFTENIETEVVQGEARAYGLELMAERSQGRVRGWISYTLSRSESRVQGINGGSYFPSNFDQLHELNIVATYVTNKRWEFACAWIYGSGRPVTYPSGKYEYNGLIVADYSTRNQNRLPAYHRLDVSATLNPRKNSKRNGTWTFSIANVYNRLNAASIFFREVSEQNGVEMATGETEAVKLSYFGIVPGASYKFNF